MKICFFANCAGSHLNWEEVFNKIEFYRVDIRLLRELGHEVTLSGSIRTFDFNADLYYCWWWGHSIFPLVISRITSKPIFVTGAFDYSTCRADLPGLCYLDRPFWQKLILRLALRMADSNLFISKYEYDEVTSNLNVSNPVLAPLAIDTDFYRPALKSGSKENFFFTVLWTSYPNVIRKGLLPTLNAFANITKLSPSCMLYIAGKSGDYEHKLKEKIHELGIKDKVIFLGMISDEEKLIYYRHCIAYVQPTLHEGFGHAIAEALACGAKVVTSASGAVPEVGGAFVQWVNPKDITSIQDGMLEALEANNDESEKQKKHDWIKDNFSLSARKKILEKYISQYIS
jgi:glycosyltransferase involved in cell wall biosynthesis